MNARTALFISVLLNLLLLAIVLRMGSGLARQDSEKPFVSVPAAGEQTAAAEAVPPFRWSQIESTNYLAYVANLRSIYCPERTIRDLIVAEMEGLYGPRRDQLHRRPGLSAPELAGQLDELACEETNLIAYILGAPLPTRQRAMAPVLAADSAPVENSTNARPSQTRPSLPLAFLSFDTNFVQLNDRQWALIQNLQRGFVAELGGTNADPASAEYAERWKKTQPEYDEMVEVLLGREAYVEFQRQAAGGLHQGATN